MSKQKTRTSPMHQTYFTSDTHFFHRNQAERRGFDSVEEMHEVMIDRWNKYVPTNAKVFIIGDLSMGKGEDTTGVLDKLAGIKVLIRGNHDKRLQTSVEQSFESIHDYLELDVVDRLHGSGNKQRISLFHFAQRVWNRHHFGAWHLYGHSHGNLPGEGRSMDVGVDTNNMRPYSFWDIHSLIGANDIHHVDHHAPRDQSQ